MAYWLFKSEPNAFGWDDQVALGTEGGQWDGVRNYQARNNMKAMQVGDLGFFYHSVDEKRIVGVVEVVAEAHRDTKADDSRWQCVDVRAVAPMPRPVTLAEIKAEPRLADCKLARQSRLSVVPISPEEWRIICKMGEFAG